MNQAAALLELEELTLSFSAPLLLQVGLDGWDLEPGSLPSRVVLQTCESTRI
jgi:hypothetical protein